MESLARRRPPLDGDRFDVVVIGGGISGVAIARECASAGQRTLLLERHDFSSGTTSRSTRIIHGGLRYLEHGEIGLVRESLRERERLLRERPHLVSPLTFVLALAAGSRHSALAIRTGLWLYRAYAGQKNGNSENGQHRLERLLDQGRKWALFAYQDAQCEFPERLVAEWLSEAEEAGAVLRNYAPALGIQVQHGRVRSVVFRDQLSGDEQRVETKWLINATGPWADVVTQQLGVLTRQPLVGGVRGSHIVLPSFPGAPETAIYSEAADGRPFFVIPWNRQLLVGSTEAAEGGNPGAVQPSAEEIEYLMNSLRRLFPTQRFEAGDITHAYSGVRPLPFSPGRPSATITRRHIFHDHVEDGVAGVISVIGGKLTTAASLARECARRIGIETREPAPAWVAEAPEDGVEAIYRQWTQQISRMANISAESAGAIAEWHGRRALPVARLASQYELLRATLCPHTHHVVAEAVAAFETEHAVTLGDVLLRRVPVAFSACWSEQCSRVAAQRIGAALTWNDAQHAQALEAFESERLSFLQPPALSQIKASPPPPMPAKSLSLASSESIA